MEGRSLHWTGMSEARVVRGHALRCDLDISNFHVPLHHLPTSLHSLPILPIVVFSGPN